ncbi:RecQ family ATP-dependent DNA helicase [Marinicella gelatinilytica]|uniref:RecQ family ATP-dependent DNA helicase n=1 Tax=Marinicella gelatinilytica TaxID=2996017 RepID=UPI002260EB71|nr:RecQ family ATP-dependent DNA helicase [Marinicella gelatinilytica]MCX7546066.1 RecQ family ATP-dependent DNA helicase [Marinicella gelatinilytica]
MNLEQLLQQTFHFTEFKAGQQQVIETIMAGQSAAAIFPTGSGKSLCYQLPAVHLPNLTLVVSPLLSLMKDQLDFLLKHGVKAARLDHTLARDDYTQVLQQAKNGALKILMISVERFKNERFRAQLKQMNMSLMVVDEAHCISEWGHNFRPDYLKLPHYQKEFNIPQCLLLTATATPKVVADMRAKFSIAEDNVVMTGFYRNNLYLQMSPTASTERLKALSNNLKSDPDAPTIVYVTLQKTAETVAEYLQRQGIQAQHYHAGMKSEEREQIQNQFMAGEVNCVVATIAFGMGIDKADVRRVIHYDLPKSIENYAQEIGRAGRDDKISLCEVLANKDDLQVQENFVYGDTPEKSAIAKLLQQISDTEEPFWETKLIALSNELNIRVLPLKTLLVYLELAGIIRPQLSYFEDYSFKSLTDQQSIIDLFEGERRDFISTLFQHCIVKKTWTYVDIQAMLANYKSNRSRIITALEWLDDQGHIELQAKQAVERFSIIRKDFNCDTLSDKMFQLFENKEQSEIDRIHTMIALFESGDCLSRQLASYFGDYSAPEHCGHCSACKSGAVSFESTEKLTPLKQFDFKQLTDDFFTAMGSERSTLNTTKFLCGIHTPIFTRLKIRALPGFGQLQQYPFKAVKSWIEANSG